MSELKPSETLTVSYGVFSCTLKGAEKPVEMMMEVTNYFRELVATDQFFGSEPLTYDAAMQDQQPHRPALAS